MDIGTDKISPSNPLLSTGQVAEMFGCSRRQVGRFEGMGLRGRSLAGGGMKRFSLKEVQRFSRVRFVIFRHWLSL